MADSTENTGNAVLGGTVATVAIGAVQREGLGIFDWLSRGQTFLGGLPPWVLILLVLAGAAWYFLRWNAQRLRKERVRDERLGLTAGRPEPTPEPCLR